MRNNFAAMGSVGLSGLSNVILQLLAATILDTEDYATFALAASTILFVVGLSRTLIGHTDLIRGERDIDRGVAAAAYILALASGVIGLAIAITGVIAWGDTLTIIAMSVLISPIFILHDSARFRAFRVQRAQWAFASDLVVLLLALGLFLTLADRWNSPIGLLLIWGGATAVGFAILVKPLHYIGRLGLWPSWWRGNKDLLIPGGLEYLLKTSVPYILNWVILFLGGAGALAGYRIVQLIFGSLGNFAQGLVAFDAPRVSSSPTRRNIMTFLGRNAALLTLSALILFFGIKYLPEGTGTEIFGNSWQEVPAFLLAGAIHGLVNALSSSNYQALRILGEARFSLMVRISTMILLPVLCLLFGIFFGVVGIAWGLAAVAVIGYVVRFAKIAERAGNSGATKVRDSVIQQV